MRYNTAFKHVAKQVNHLTHTPKLHRLKPSLSPCFRVNWTCFGHTGDRNTCNQGTIHGAHISAQNREQNARKRSAVTHNTPIYLILKDFKHFYILNFKRYKYCFKSFGSTTLTEYKHLCEWLRMPDDGLVWPRHVTEFTWQHGLCGDSTNDLWTCTEDSTEYMYHMQHSNFRVMKDVH